MTFITTEPKTIKYILKADIATLDITPLCKKYLGYELQGMAPETLVKLELSGRLVGMIQIYAPVGVEHSLI